MPEQAELWRRTTQRGLLIASYQRTEEKTDMAVTPVAEAVRVPAHLVLPASPAPPSQSTLTGAELPKAKKGLVSTHVGLLVIPNSLPPCGLWPTKPVRGVLQARILESIGQRWLPHPPRALYFLLP